MNDAEMEEVSKKIVAALDQVAPDRRLACLRTAAFLSGVDMPMVKTKLVQCEHHPVPLAPGMCGLCGDGK